MSATAPSRLSTSLNAGRNTLTRRRVSISVRPREGGLHVRDPGPERCARLEDVEAGLRDRHRVRMEGVLERLRHLRRAVGRGDPGDRSLEVRPALLGTDPGDL